MCWGTIWKDNILYLLKLDHFAGRQSAPQPLPRLQLHLQPSVQVIMTTEMLLKNQYFRISLDFTCYFVWLRQDSELQSVSSHNDTTDDNQSSFTESSSHYSNTYRWLLLKFLLRETLLVFLVTIDTFDIALLCPDIEYQLMKTPKHVKCWALVLQFQQLCKPAVRIKGADFDLLCMQ